MASYRKINYSLRPAKNIERKMLSEAFRRLSTITRVDQYRYIGFGSTYFSDFELFHKELGITNMLSIEADAGSQLRFKFNRPFSCINFEFDHSYNVLPTLKYDQKDIIWLDYDGFLENYMFEDIDTIISNVQMGSVFLISFNVEPPRASICDDEKKDPTKMKEKMRNLLEEVNVRLSGRLNIAEEMKPGNTESILKDWNFAKKCKLLIDEQIQKSIKNRADRESKSIHYQQLFNFHYSDGAKMLTIGGIIYDKVIAPNVVACSFTDLPFVKSDEDAMLIDVPNLTYREIKYLNKYISSGEMNKFPKDDAGNTIDQIVPSSEISMFHKVYRYFSTFSEANL